MNAIYLRSSVRQYTDEPVDIRDIEKLMRAAMAAPSAVNQQPWEFYVVRDKRVIQDLSHCSPYAGCAAGASLAIVVCSRDENMSFTAFVNLDFSAAVENILLEAVHLDLGAVWLGVAPYKAREVLVRRSLGVPKGLTPFAIVAMEYHQATAKEKNREDRYDPSRVHYV